MSNVRQAIVTLNDHKPTVGVLIGVSGKPSVWVDLLKLAQSFPLYGNNMDASLSFQHNTTINAYFCALFGTNEFQIVEWSGLPDSLKDPLDHVCIIELKHLAECFPSDLSEAEEYAFYDWEFLMRLAESTTTND